MNHRSLRELRIIWNVHSRKRRLSTNYDGDNEPQAATRIAQSYAAMMSQIPLSDVRNFCFIAHVDHGKSSLASRVLELLGNFSLTQESFGNVATPENSNVPNNEHSKEDMQTSSDKNSKEDYLKLDTLTVEQQRGITVKASAASMLYKPRDPTICSPDNPTKHLLFNMVDTPGHVDFGFEVSRSLQAVQGALLLFDASQGIQAQSLSVYQKAKEIQHGRIALMPVLTKIDLPHARPLEVALAISDVFGFDPDAVIHTSARSRIGIEEILEAVAMNVPPPTAVEDASNSNIVPFHAQVVDSWFEPLRGVVCLVKVLAGTIREGNRMAVLNASFFDNNNNSTNNKDHFSVQEIGMVFPHRIRTHELTSGRMGYAVVGLRDPRQARPGSILVAHADLNFITQQIAMDPENNNTYVDKHNSSWLTALKRIATQNSSSNNEKSVLFASVHPMEAYEFDELVAAVDRLALNDTGLEVHRTSGASNSAGENGGPFLGPGLRIGFQGLLHVEVFRQRLLDEFGMEAIVTPPKVPYTIQYLPSKSSRRSQDDPMEEVIEDLANWPQSGERFDVLEPIVAIRVIAPVEYAGSVMELIKRKRGYDMETQPIDDANWMFTAHMPWGEVVTDFHDSLKNCTAGYASFDTTEAGVKKGKLAKVSIMLNGDVVEPLTFVSHVDAAQAEARVVCKKLKETLPREQFVIRIQAKAEGKIVASESIKAYRKDVLTTGGSKAVGGGDITRKKKLLEKQKRGKKRLQSQSGGAGGGKVRLSQAAFNSVIARSN